ncbi:hypothetical protein ABT237_23015 [Streptomyces sp. NPDC001581]|uniref:hypothetical protein n=1 Tax=Streptomyces sp. NPDC001581 TaxID=3154386 RepID=UPI00332BDD66
MVFRDIGAHTGVLTVRGVHYVAAVAEMTGIGLATEVEQKLLKNSARTYERNSHGALIRVSGN